MTEHTIEKIITLNSVYEIDREAKRVRRVSGDNPPTRHFDPDGEWKSYMTTSEFAGGIWFIWPDGHGTLTSRIVDRQ